ncbi:MAG: amidohydrolase family protein [Blastocatellia bacterium]
MKSGSQAVKRALTFVSIIAFLSAPNSFAQTAPQTGIGQKPAEHYFVKCKLLINPDTGQTIENAVVEVSSGRIARVGKSADFNLPVDARVLDYGDKFIIPGLVDTHGHFYGFLNFGHSVNEALPPLYLAAGVTSVLSPGSGNPEGDLALKNRIDSGRAPGPRLFLAGEYLQMAPSSVPWMETVATENEAKAKLDHWISRGASAVKMYEGMKGDIMRATIAHAHLRGVKVNGHLGVTTWTEAIEMGIDVLHHGIYAFPEIEPEGMPPTALGMINFAPPEFDKYFKALAEADLTQPKVRAVFKAAAESKVVFVPTVVALAPYDRDLDHMPEQQQFYAPDAWKKVEGRFQAEKKPYALLVMKKNLEFVRRAHEAGCLLSTGTDMTNFQLLPGYSLWREMDLFAEAGLKPMDVLKAATINGAFAIGRSDQLGSVEAGKLADFVILNANPLENISHARAVHRVVKGGVIYHPEEILKSLKGRIH